MNYHGRREICANCKHMNRERFPKCVCECRLSRSYKQEVFMGESCGRWREKVPDVIGVSALYREILKVTNSDERGHWYSDLYCKRKPETTRLLDKYQFRNQVSTFTDRITGKLWYCIPFAYNPTGIWLYRPDRDYWYCQPEDGKWVRGYPVDTLSEFREQCMIV